MKQREKRERWITARDKSEQKVLKSETEKRELKEKRI